MNKVGILSVLFVLVLASVALAEHLVQITVPVDGFNENVGTPINFDGTVLDREGVGLTTYTWNFGDNTPVVSGNTAAGADQIPVTPHTYNALGAYTVRLTVRDANGADAFNEIRVNALREDIKFKTSTGVSLAEAKVSVEDGQAVAMNNLVVLVNEGNKALNGVKARFVLDANKNGAIEADEINVVADKQGDLIRFTFGQPQINLAANNNAAGGQDEVPVTLTLNIDDGFDVSEFKEGKLQVVDAQTNNLVLVGGTALEIPFKVRSGEAFCVAGPKQDGRITVDIKNPEDDDELRIGEKFKVQVDVDNGLNEDEDFVIEAFLYNVDKGKKVDKFKTSEKGIDSDEEETFNFEMELDPEEVDDDKDNVVLFLKIFADGKEETICAEKEVELDLKQDDSDVRFKEFTLLPSTASCAAPVEARVSVRNFGSEDTDTVIKLVNRELGLDLRSPSFELEQLQSDSGESDDSKTLRFNFILPENVKAGQYNIEATANFADGDNSATQTLTVAECRKDETPKAEEQPKAPAVVVTTTTPAQPTVQTQQPSVQQPSVAPTVFTQRDIFDVFNRDRTPTALWIALDLVLVLLIVIVVYMVVNKRKR